MSYEIWELKVQDQAVPRWDKKRKHSLATVSIFNDDIEVLKLNLYDIICLILY